MTDNQFIKNRGGLFGLFEQTMPAFNRMLRAVRLTIPVQHEEDYTVIPVVVHNKNGSVYTVEGGIVTGRSIDVQDTEDDFDYSDEWKEREQNEEAN